MVARHFYRADPDDAVEEVVTVLRWGYQAGEKAEEGEAGMIEVVVDDPDMSLDFVGHRSWTIYEDDAEGDNLVFFGGFTQAVRIAHKGGNITQPLGRVWTIEVADMNTLWQYRLLTNDECDRPAETDVERMQWLVSTPEFEYIEDVSSFISTASPVSMDAADVRGQTPGQVADSCAQQSGKNWWLKAIDDALGGDGRTTFIWYGDDSVTDYTSPLFLSNDPADLDMSAVNDGSATTYPIGKDTELRRDYARQYSGAYGEYQTGSRYVQNSATIAVLTPHRSRDMAHPAPEIKSKSIMDARLRRVLRDHAGPDHVIKTTTELTGNKLTHLLAGMRVPFKATHIPDYETPRYLRVLSAMPSPTGRRGDYETYNVALELQGPGAAVIDPEPEPGGDHYYVIGAVGSALTQVGWDGITIDGVYHPEPGGVPPTWEQDPTGLVYYYRTGGSGWNFPYFNGIGPGAIDGDVDYGFGNSGNIVVIGPFSAGTELVIHTVSHPDPTRHSDGGLYQIYETNTGAGSGYTIIGTITETAVAGDDYSFTVS